MAIYNQTFFDLNNKRGYCVDGAAGLPPETISDLKISVPNFSETIRMSSIFLRDETVRMIFVAVCESGIKPVALFNSDDRSMLRVGIPYPLLSLAEGYGGLIVFGEGIRRDIDVTISLPVSEECLTRFEPSAIPYVSLVCDSVKLAGEVAFSSGDPARLVSDGIDVPEELFGCTRALRLALVDSGTVDTSNPMIEMANGINTYFTAEGTEGRRSPVYKLFGAMPDSSGTVYIRFDEHFHFVPVGDPEQTTSILAIGTDLTTDEICHAVNETEDENEDKSEPACPASIIEFEVIEYE